MLIGSTPVTSQMCLYRTFFFVQIRPSRFRSETEAALHVAEPPVPRVRAALVQPVRPASQHELPRRLAEPHAQVRAAAVHGATVSQSAW